MFYSIIVLKYYKNYLQQVITKTNFMPLFWINTQIDKCNVIQA